jgi:hypothetical protein
MLRLCLSCGCETCTFLHVLEAAVFAVLASLSGRLSHHAVIGHVIAGYALIMASLCLPRLFCYLLTQLLLRRLSV